MSFGDFSIKRLNSTDDRPQSFKCSDSDLNEFFFVDSVKWDEQLLAVTYLVYIENNPVAYFSVSNDAIKKENLSNSRFKRLTRSVPHSKRYHTMPAVKIGRLATGEQWAGNGVGTFKKHGLQKKIKQGADLLLLMLIITTKPLIFTIRMDSPFY